MILPQSTVPQLVHLKKSLHLVCHSPPIVLLQRFSYTSLAPQSPNNPSKMDEPTTGPAFWEKRRAEWLAAGQQPIPPADDNGPGSRARARLEILLAPHLAEESDLVWNDTVGAIWKGLTRGDKLKRNLPLPIVVSVPWNSIYSEGSYDFIDQNTAWRLATGWDMAQGLDRSRR
jgi:hypothetical protein